MSYYLVNEKRIELPENFNGIAVFYPKETDEKISDEQKVLFQRLFENGLNMKMGEILWVETAPLESDFTFKNKDKLNCCLFFGVDPARSGFRVQLPLNKFAAVNNIQLLQTLSPKELNQKPEMKKVLWNALQVLK